MLGEVGGHPQNKNNKDLSNKAHTQYIGIINFLNKCMYRLIILSPLNCRMPLNEVKTNLRSF